MEINPRDLTEQQAYSFMVSSILPRPVAWISTISADGTVNVAPFSYFMGVCCDPMTLLFCPVAGTPDRPKKDTLLNIEEVPEFVVNVADERVVEAVNRSAAPFPRGESELGHVGATPLPSSRVRPPRIQEASISFECEVSQIVEVNSGPGGGWVVLGTVLAIHVADEIVDPDTWHVDLDLLRPVARLGRGDFLRSTDTFSLHRFKQVPELAAGRGDS